MIRQDHFVIIVGIFQELAEVYSEVASVEKQIADIEEKMTGKTKPEIRKLSESVNMLKKEKATKLKKAAPLFKKIFDRLIHFAFPGTSCDVEVIINPSGMSVKDVEFINMR